jgi:hypothetical protein
MIVILGFVIFFCVILPIGFALFMLESIPKFLIGCVILAGLYWVYQDYTEWLDQGMPTYEERKKLRQKNS